MRAVRLGALASAAANKGPLPPLPPPVLLLPPALGTARYFLLGDMIDAELDESEEAEGDCADSAGDP